jgi:hypothetical protein
MPDTGMKHTYSTGYRKSGVPPPEQTFYIKVIDTLASAHIPFLVSGGFAFASYTGIARATKDLDLLVSPENFSQTMDVCSTAGFETKVRFAHWIGKVIEGEHVVDIIFSSGNGLCTVDSEWFQYAVPDTLFAHSVRLCPPEELIWSKAFIMERNRFDGADIAHILNAKGKELDWARILRRFHSHWRVLLSHLILYGYIFPSDCSQVPHWLMTELIRRIDIEKTNAPSSERICQGTLLSWSQYLPDIEQRGYQDARHFHQGHFTKEQTVALTNIFLREEESPQLS